MHRLPGLHGCVPHRGRRRGGRRPDSGGPRRLPERFACARACCSGALSRIGEELDARTLVERVMAQHMSWRAEGGVTLSGGEPLAQPDFAAELLQRFREEGVGTALETCGYVPFEAFQKAAPFCQLIFFDLKCMASEVHRRYTGVDNRRILDNLMALSREFPDLPLRVRTPLIPGVNDGREQLSEIVQFLRRLPSLADYQLLPYHNWGVGKIPPAGPELSTGRTGAAGQGGGKAPQRRAAG